MRTLRELIIQMIVARRSRGEQWNAGDLAVCIAENWEDKDGDHPKVDDYLRVSAVCGGGLWLHFEGRAPDLHYEANAFRKVVHDLQHAADEDWADDLKRLRRKEPV
ncbi:MAG: hypothetical protein ABIV36_18415 [Sphingobium limneticum]